MADKNEWIAAIETATDFKIDGKELDHMSPQFSYAGWRIAIEHTKTFRSVVLKWLAAADDKPAPVEGWLVCPNSDQHKGWDYRVYLAPRELKSLLRTLDSLPQSKASRHQAFKSRTTQDDQFLVFFNNSRRRDHVTLYGKDAFYDLNTTGWQSTQARNLRIGQECIVATPATPPNHDHVAFAWFSFLRESVKRDDTGLPCRVFFGKALKSETYSKIDAARRVPYSTFFNVDGHFKRQSVICRAVPMEGQSSRDKLTKISYTDDIDPNQGYYEGVQRSVVVNSYERNAAARDACISHYGACCVICHFDFGKFYGEVGQGLIHVHHLVPLAAIGESYKVNPIEDMQPVCPNCHSIIHRKTPPFTIEEVREFVRSSGSRSNK